MYDVRVRLPWHNYQLSHLLFEDDAVNENSLTFGRAFERSFKSILSIFNTQETREITIGMLITELQYGKTLEKIGYAAHCDCVHVLQRFKFCVRSIKLNKACIRFRYDTLICMPQSKRIAEHSTLLYSNLANFTTFFIHEEI